MAKYDIHVRYDGALFYETGEVRLPQFGEAFLSALGRVLAPVHADYVAYPLLLHPDGSPTGWRVQPDRPTAPPDEAAATTTQPAAPAIAAPASAERYPLCPWQGEKTFAVGERVIDKEWGPGVVVSRAKYMANAHCPGYDNHCVPVLFDNEVACLGRRYATISGSDLTREAPQSARSSPERARGWAPQGDVGAACFGNITDADAVALAANQPRTPQVREARRLDPYRPVREPRQYRAGLVGYDGEGW